MDFRDSSIITQVAFKGAIDLCRDIDVTTGEGQAEFVQAFSFLTDALFEGVRSQTPADERAAEVIRGAFPGTTNVQPDPTTYAPQQQQYPMAPQQQTLTVKGTQHGALPGWLYEAAAAKGVTEVYDNRDRAQGTKRPYFRSTTGGDDAPAFWPPR